MPNRFSGELRVPEADAPSSKQSADTSPAEQGAASPRLEAEYVERVARWFYHNPNRPISLEEVKTWCGPEILNAIFTVHPGLRREVDRLGCVKVKKGEKAVRVSGVGGEREVMELRLIACNKEGGEEGDDAWAFDVPFELTREGTYQKLDRDLRGRDVMDLRKNTYAE